jgi:hypothetical protein
LPSYRVHYPVRAQPTPHFFLKSSLSPRHVQVELFNGKLGDELLNREIFYTLTEAKALVGGWRREYNGTRPHSALGYRPPAPKAIECSSVGDAGVGGAFSASSLDVWYHQRGQVTLSDPDGQEFSIDCYNRRPVFQRIRTSFVRVTPARVLPTTK